MAVLLCEADGLLHSFVEVQHLAYETVGVVAVLLLVDAGSLHHEEESFLALLRQIFDSLAGCCRQIIASFCKGYAGREEKHRGCGAVNCIEIVDKGVAGLDSGAGLV